MLHAIFYSHFIVPKRFEAVTYGPFIFIRPDCKGNRELVEHELVHVKHFWHNPLFGLWYLFSKKARFKYEAEAYREQLRYVIGGVDKTEVFANILVKNYNLGITIEEARAALK